MSDATSAVWVRSQNKCIKCINKGAGYIFGIKCIRPLYWPLEAIRRLALKGTELANAYVGTLRLKLLKIGAVILRNTRRIRFLLSSACPYQQRFLDIHAAVYNLFNLGRHLVSAKTFRFFRLRAFAYWKSAVVV